MGRGLGAEAQVSSLVKCRALPAGGGPLGTLQPSCLRRSWPIPGAQQA